ncbi:MAG TPA: hypothetical protein VIL49_17430 [Capillimicrobium sp.]
MTALLAAPAVEAWNDLFVAAAGAGAALAGLVFVAVSINVERILQFRGLPERGLITVLLLLSVVVVSLMGLVPEQGEKALGVHMLCSSLAVIALSGWLIWRSRPRPGEEHHVASTILIAAIGTVPFLVGALLLLGGDDAGLYWAYAGITCAIVGGVANAWVLLVEILR